MTLPVLVAAAIPMMSGLAALISETHSGNLDYVEE